MADKHNPMVDNWKAIELNRRIKQLMRRQVKLNTMIDDCVNEMKDVCEHPDTVIKERYVEGGYLDREEYITTVTCELCKTVLDTTTKVGGFC